MRVVRMLLAGVAALAALVALAGCTGVNGQVPIPYRVDGYPLSPPPGYGAPIQLEAFVDLLCPDCAQAWPNLVQVANYYGTNASVWIHTFPLPYHTNGFVLAQAAHTAIDQMSYAPQYNIELLGMLFENQQTFWNDATKDMTATEVQAKLRELMVGAQLIDGPTFDAGMASATINEETRVSWKYGCSRAVTGTPTFLVNGVTVAADPSWTLDQWRQVLDPLLQPQPSAKAKAVAVKAVAPVRPVVKVPRMNLRVSVPGAPAGEFPYTFPYSEGRHIVSDFSLQMMRLYDGDRVLMEFPMSSGKLGIGFTPESPGSPSGKFRVSIKVGSHAKMYEIIEKLSLTGRIGKESDALAHMQTRILVLEGLDRNQYYDNTNTRGRSIYIHGTNKESKLGTRQSHGCFRIGNQEVKDLFDAVNTGVEYFAVPEGAWPY